MTAASRRARLMKRLGQATQVVGRTAAVLIGFASLTAAGALFLLTQTVVGRNAAASFVQEALEGVVHGDVRLGPILGGNLFTRAHVAHFELAEAGGTPFVRLEGVRLEYNPLGFLIGTYRFNRVTAERAELRLHQHEDGRWNFDRLFGSDDDGPEGGPGTTRVLLSDVEIRSGRIEVHTPWARGLSGAERDSAIAAGLRGDRLWRVRRIGPEEVQRVITLDSLSGRFPLLRLVDPVRPMRLEMSGISAAAEVVTQTLDVRRFDGAATFRDTIDIDVDHLETPHSTLSGTGWVVPTDPPQFSFDLDADPMGFADLQWLPIPVPAGGGGPADVGIWTRGDVIVVRAGNGDVRVDDSRVRGGFVVALEEVPRFESLDVRLAPVRLALVDDLIDREPLVDGYIEGPLSGTGPIGLLSIDADLELRDLTGERRPSYVKVQGGVGIGEPREMRDLRLLLREFSPRWTAVIGIQNAVGGRAEGTAEFTGFAGGPFDFTADVAHRLETGEASRVMGSGRVDLAQSSEVDVEFTADPLALAVLQPYLPEVDLAGEVRGPISARGALSDLRVVADLRTPRGLLNFDGRFDVAAEERAYDARLLARDIQLQQWFERGPATRLAVEGRVRGRGSDPETLEATFDLTVLRSLVEGARVDSSLLRFTVAEGLATADTFAIRSDAGAVDGRGSFGLGAGRRGSLILELDVPDLSSWNRWLVPGRNPARQDTSLTALFAAFPEAGEEEEPGPEATEAARDTLAGSLAALGVVYGNLKDFSLGGRALARSLSYGGYRADSVLLIVDSPRPVEGDSLGGRVAAWNVEGFGTRADTLFVRWQRRTPEESELELYALRDTTAELSTHAFLRWTPQQRTALIDRLQLSLGPRQLSLSRTAEVVYGDSGFVARGLSLAGADDALVELDGTVLHDGAADLDFRIRGIRLENLLGFPDLAQDLTGLLEGELRLRGTADSPRWDARLEVREPVLYGLPYERLASELRYADRRLDVRAALHGNGTELGRLEGHIRADLALRARDRRLLADPLHLTVVADSFPLEPLEVAFESLRDVTGFGRGRVGIGGEPGDLRLDGEARLAGGAATVPYLGVRFRDVTSEISFRGSEAHLRTATFASSAGGSGSVSGVVDVGEPTDPRLDLQLEARKLVAMSRRVARFVLDGQGRLTGSYRHPELTGTWRLSEGDIRAERFLRQQQVVDLTDPDVYSLIDTTLVMEQRLFRQVQNPFMRNLRMNSNVRIGPNFWLRSSALEVELAGEIEVRMDRAQQDLVAFGVLELQRGKYRYVSGSGSDISSLYSRQLQIAGGTITFVGSPGMNPNLDINATYETRSNLGPVTITVNIGGTSLSPTMTTSSDPPLPEADEICYLLFSTACLGAGAEGGEFASSLVREGLLGTVGNQFSQVLVSGVGLVDYFDIRSTGSVETEPGAGSGSALLYGTEVEIGQYLTPDLFVKATQPLGGQLPGFSVEWEITPRWRLELKTEDRWKRYASYGYTFSTYSDRTWGLMLFRDWSF